VKKTKEVYCGVYFYDIYSYKKLLPIIKDLLEAKFSRLVGFGLEYQEIRGLIPLNKIVITKGMLTYIIFSRNIKIGVNVDKMKNNQSLLDFERIVTEELFKIKIKVKRHLVFFT